jgi:Zn-dependent protease
MGNLRLGKIFGIPIQVNLSFLLLLLLLLIWQGLGGVVLLLVAFSSVLVHELGHALVARRLHVPIISIELHFFGGAARMARMPSSPREEILIAAAGPVVSFAISLLGGLLYLLFGFFGFGYLALINLILGGFNLLPALPMDGGRIFRALLCRKMGRLRATSIAVKVAKTIAVGLGLLGLTGFNFFLVGLAVVLWLMASAELRAAQIWSRAGQWPGGAHARPSAAGEAVVLDQPGRPVSGDSTFAQTTSPQTIVVEELHRPGRQRWVIRDGEGRILFVADHPLQW